MKEMFRKNVLCILALFLMGGMSASGVTTVYNLVKAEEGITELPTWGEKVTSGGVSLNTQAYGQENFDNRIAVGLGKMRRCLSNFAAYTIKKRDNNE